MSGNTNDEWRVDIVKHGGDWTWNIRDNRDISISTGRHIATVNKYLRDVEAVSALLAAAPEMLDACIAALSQLTEDRPEYYEHDVEQLKRVIARATGGE